MTHSPRPLTLVFTVLPALALAACDAPNPADYGGGAKGEAIAKCVSKTERADSAVTREQAGDMCTCIADKTYASLNGGGMGRASLERAFVGCARNAGIEITG